MPRQEPVAGVRHTRHAYVNLSPIDKAGTQKPARWRISERLDIITSTLSGHPAILKRAGLVKSTRHQREIHYSADIGAMNDLTGFLLQDCCNAQLENCREILALLNIPQA